MRSGAIAVYAHQAKNPSSLYKVRTISHPSIRTLREQSENRFPPKLSLKRDLGGNFPCSASLEVETELSCHRSRRHKVRSAERRKEIVKRFLVCDINDRHPRAP